MSQLALATPAQLSPKVCSAFPVPPPTPLRSEDAEPHPGEPATPPLLGHGALGSPGSRGVKPEKLSLILSTRRSRENSHCCSQGTWKAWILKLGDLRCLRLQALEAGGGTGEELLLEPPPYQPVPQAEPQDIPGEVEAAPPWEAEGHPLQTRRRLQRGQPWLVADSTVLLRPVRPLNEAGDQQMQYWPFATSNLYNWKLQTAKFSEKPQGLIDLLESVLFTHQPTWDDIQQLLQVLFTTEERDQIQVEARKLLREVDGNPTTNQALIDEAFPLVRENWDFNVAEELLVVAEKVYNHRESPEDKQARVAATASAKQTHDFAKILLATSTRSPGEREHQLQHLSAEQAFP
ncbi:uncharacterized protein LOC115069268 [Nannospalax galili]|uniref:uncharacterized protein LOC115069268 n=1 Tax=Nannospalax galili TaxID=1026970 RepID=UPI00111C5406|nr:uncharacterized protein LOC115069268 [Nannospalax galili]